MNREQIVGYFSLFFIVAPCGHTVLFQSSSSFVELFIYVMTKITLTNRRVREKKMSDMCAAGGTNCVSFHFNQ